MSDTPVVGSFLWRNPHDVVGLMMGWSNRNGVRLPRDVLLVIADFVSVYLQAGYSSFTRLRVRSVLSSPHPGELFLVAANAHELIGINVDSHSRVFSYRVKNGIGRIASAAVSVTRRYVAALVRAWGFDGPRANSVVIFDTVGKTRAIVRLNVLCHKVAFLRDDSVLVSPHRVQLAGYDDTADDGAFFRPAHFEVFHPDTGKRTCRLKLVDDTGLSRSSHTAGVDEVITSPDRNLLLIRFKGDSDRYYRVVVEDVATMLRTKVIRWDRQLYGGAERGEGCVLAVRPDNNYVAVGDGFNVTVYRLTADVLFSERVAVLYGHLQLPYTSMGFSRDGFLFVAAQARTMTGVNGPRRLFIVDTQGHSEDVTEEYDFIASSLHITDVGDVFVTFGARQNQNVFYRTMFPSRQLSATFR